MSRNSLFGPVDPAREAGYEDPPPRKGFFTDTSVCIGCKACEVACKEWNLIPDDGFDLLGSSYDNSGELGGSTWRHVTFVEQTGPPPVSLGMPGVGPPDPHADGHAASEAPSGLPTVTGDEGDVDALAAAGQTTAIPDGEQPDFRWLMSSDVCKHCTHAACLDVCPTGALMRTEFGTVVVQDDVCNGCGYCVAACPYGVIERRKGPEGTRNIGIAQKCTLCYDRLGAGQEPACAKACPTDSIQFGDLDELRERAEQRLGTVRSEGEDRARLYGNDDRDGVGGAGAFFLLLDEPEVYGLPPDPVVTTRDLPSMFNHAGVAGLALLAGAAAAFLGGRR
ncbi:4Fe-4S dicluster domain-containing protein [Georgenia halophila]|uniref:4Fe-4S dicluster domain-containing protein n=1 Tax=Georgenia halophila TaxID=620889 RepID=A0ABP8KWJ9_9MICO